MTTLVIVFIVSVLVFVLVFFSSAISVFLFFLRFTRASRCGLHAFPISGHRFHDLRLLVGHFHDRQAGVAHVDRSFSILD